LIKNYLINQPFLCQFEKNTMAGEQQPLPPSFIHFNDDMPIADAVDREVELAALHRSYRMMETDRQKYTEESQNIIKKQRQAIDKIKKENEQLKEQLAAESQSISQPLEGGTLAYITKSQAEVEYYEHKIDLEQRRLEELDKQSKMLFVKGLEMQQSRGGVNAVKESDRAVQKQIRILENRLDKALVKFNEVLAYNKQLRSSSML
jgi:hypothetical protein